MRRETRSALVSTVTILSILLGICVTSYRLAHLSALPLTSADKLIIGLGIGLFVVSLFDFWRGHIRRGLVLTVVRFLITGAVAVHLDVPLAEAGILPNYALSKMRVAVTHEQKLQASMLVLTFVDHSPALSLLTESPRRIVFEKRCTLVESEYEAHVAHALPAIAPYFAHHLAACKASAASRSEAAALYLAATRLVSHLPSALIASAVAAADGNNEIARSLVVRAIASKNEHARACLLVATSQRHSARSVPVYMQNAVFESAALKLCSTS